MSLELTILTILEFVYMYITIQKHYELHQEFITVSNMTPQSRNLNMENCQNNRLRFCDIYYGVSYDTDSVLSTSES